MAEVYVNKGQGVLVRRCAFALIVLLVIWGTMSLYGWLVNLEIGGGHPFATLLVEKSGTGYVLPVLGQKFDVACIVTWVLAGASIFGIWRLLNRPRAANFLIETDAELRKVTWPNWKDAWNSALVVLVFVFIMAGFLVASDKIVATVVDNLMVWFGP